MRIPQEDTLRRERGSTLILVLILSSLLLSLAMLALTEAQTHTTNSRLEWELHSTRTGALSGINEAIGQVKFGIDTPMSGGGANPAWIAMGTVEVIYRTTYVAPNYTITAYGRVANGPNAQANAGLLPGDLGYDPTDWTIRGYRVTMVANKNLPDAPLYFGNGGVERTRGGIAWNSNTHPDDPLGLNPPNVPWSFYGVTSGSHSSWMSDGLSFRADARGHPADYLDNMGASPVTPDPLLPDTIHNFFAAQNKAGQHDNTSFFMPWNGNDPGTKSAPDLTDTTLYPNRDTDPTDGGYSDTDDAFPIDPDLPDVQTWAWQLYADRGGPWGNDSDTVHLTSDNGSLPQDGGADDADSTSDGTLTIGTSANPKVAFSTGRLLVNSDKKIKGYGILIVRDDFHPTFGTNTTNNRPTGSDREARIDIRGRLEWTGLVIIAGWRPNITTEYMNDRDSSDVTSAGGDPDDPRTWPADVGRVIVNGAFFGEDSVQSGGEVALDLAQIIMRIGTKDDGNGVRGRWETKFSPDMFKPGGLIWDLLPLVNKTVVAVEELQN